MFLVHLRYIFGGGEELLRNLLNRISVLPERKTAETSASSVAVASSLASPFLLNADSRLMLPRIPETRPILFFKFLSLGDLGSWPLEAKLQGFRLKGLCF